MTNQKSVRRRWMLMCSAGVAGLAWNVAALAAPATSAAMADVAATSEAEAPSDVGELVVTGSRIPRLNLESATPTVAVTAAKIEASSNSEVGALLRDLPASGVSFASPQTTGSLVSNNFGTSTFNLRNLGENRTLVLVDSRRFVSGSASGNFVDFNAIPLEMIERIDVVTGGASAIYGSDALAGVVNVITRKNFRGLVISGQGGKGIYGDAQNYRISATGGAPFADGAGEAVISLNWSRDDGAFARNRPWEAVDSVAAAALGAVDSSDVVSVISPFFSSYSEKGRINLTNGTRYVVDDDGVVKSFVTARDGFNRQAFRGISAPLQRLGASANLDYKVSDAIKWFAQLTYNSTRAQVAAEPFPLDSYNIYGGNRSANQQQCPTPAPGGAVHCIYGIPLTSAIVPEAIRVLERAAQPGVPDSDLVVGFSRRMSDIATRDGYALRQTYRVVTGFTGDLPGASPTTPALTTAAPPPTSTPPARSMSSACASPSTPKLGPVAFLGAATPPPGWRAACRSISSVAARSAPPPPTT
jgi:iron complex outermembrane receptor protein